MCNSKPGFKKMLQRGSYSEKYILSNLFSGILSKTEFGAVVKN